MVSQSSQPLGPCSVYHDSVYPASVGAYYDSPYSPSHKRLSSETWSNLTGLPLFHQPRKEPWMLPVLRWLFILLALALLGFVLVVFGHLVQDYLGDRSTEGWRPSKNKTVV